LHAPDAAGPGDIVIVPAAAGGIGTLLVQYAKNAGARVVGLAGGPEKAGRVLENGADLAVDYKQPDWPDQVRGYLGDRRATVVFDSVGGTTARAAVDLLRAVTTSSSAGRPRACGTAAR
jgi:NADPH2:quinone reductase